MKDNWRRTVKQDPSEQKTTILVVSGDKVLFEPAYLAALANHPDCERILLAPIADAKGEWMSAIQQVLIAGQEKHSCEPLSVEPSKELDVYDVTSALKADKPINSLSIGEVKHNVQAYVREHEPFRHSLSDVDLCINATNEPFFGVFLQEMQPQLLCLNDPTPSCWVDNKSALPSYLNREGMGAFDWIPKQTDVASAGDIDGFMRQQNISEAIVKSTEGVAGGEVFRTFRDPHNQRVHIENPKVDWSKPVRRLKGFNFKEKEWVVTEKLDPSKGDWRAVFAFGKCVGVYNRLPAEGTWMCNVGQGGDIQPMTLEGLNSIERLRLNLMAKFLDRKGIHFAATDWMENEKGRRFMTEVNPGLLASLTRLHSLGQTDVVEIVADDTMAWCQSQKVKPEMELAAR